MEHENRDDQIRKMAQDAHLDQDTESMVPPTWRGSTSLIVSVLFCVVALGLIAILVMAIG
ncbi:hypothetical protein ACQQ2Q_15910 [Agrobacterium sp. ES01]|uniref:hypothetical protein n=1 Tax=Agrobacterium sp. ES01 TaxID=3420714 RepID=UPI003D0AB3FF